MKAIAIASLKDGVTAWSGGAGVHLPVGPV